ncbi:MAG: serine hydrolase [Clostridia bacterium]|nr:serine hydrolase [Clostridia bacterium]
MFKNVTPESIGISSKYVKDFILRLEKRKLHMHSVILCRGTNIFGEFYWSPFNRDFLHRMYSETKSYVSVAIGLLLDEGKLSLDDKIIDYFPEKIDTSPCESIKNQTIRNMLMMSTVGYGENWFGNSDKDRCHLYFNKRPNNVRYPGTIWEYDSQGSQILCALVEKLAKKPLFDYLNEKIFSHLGTFKNATILKIPTGESWGDSALLCTSRDMLSFARFVMNLGEWNGKRLLSERYLREATSNLIDNQETAFEDVIGHGYGYQIWRTEKNGFAFVGMGDQLTICLPDYDLIFVCTADNQGCGYSREILMSSFFDIIVENLENAPLSENNEAFTDMQNATQGLSLFAIKGQETSSWQDKINGIKYVFSENELGLKDLCFNFNGIGGELHYTNENGEMVLPFLLNKNYFGKFPELGYSQDIGNTRTLDGSKYDMATSGAWLCNNQIMIFSQIIDRYFGNVSMRFGFNDDRITVTFYKTAEDFLWNYNGQAYGKMSKH